jgi:hypothetical protein
MATSYIRELRFLYHPKQWERFRGGDLANEWIARHIGLFDRDDQRIKATQPTRHFFEWLASVMFRESLGYHALVEKYDLSAQGEKRSRFRRIAGAAAYAEVMRDRTGVPDLFLYAPDESSWFFCEVKGGTEPLQDHQELRFEQLHKVTNRPVYVVHFDEAEF